MKLHVKKGDMVQVIAGDDKGKIAKVLKVYPEKNRAIVEGVNVNKKHTKPNARNTQGGIVEQEAPIHISNLMVVVGKTPTKIGRRVDEKTGKIVRYSKKHGRRLSNGIYSDFKNQVQRGNFACSDERVWLQDRYAGSSSEEDNSQPRSG